MKGKSYIAMCLEDLRNYKGKDITGMVVFPYNNVSFPIDYKGNLIGDPRYISYVFNRLKNSLIYLIKKGNGELSLEVSSLKQMGG